MKRPSENPKNASGKSGKVKSGKSGKPKKPPAPPPQFAPAPQLDVPPNAILEVRAHLSKFLEKPIAVADLRGNPSKDSAMQRLEIAAFAPAGKASTTVFATCGASQIKMSNGRRMEALLMVRPSPEKEQAEAIVQVLSAVALYPERQQVALEAGAVIKSREDVRKICPMDALLLMPPLSFVGEFARLRRTDGQWVDFLWVIPIHEVEADFALQQGPGKLFQRFTDEKVDLAVLDRPVVDLVGKPAAPSTAAKPGASKAAAPGAKPVAKPVAKPAPKPVR